MELDLKKKVFIYAIGLFVISCGVLWDNAQINRAEINIDFNEVNETIRQWTINHPYLCINMTKDDLDNTKRISDHFSINHINNREI